MRFSFPDLLAIDERLNGNRIQQLIKPSYNEDVEVEEYTAQRAKGYIVRSPNDEALVLLNSARPPETFAKVLRMDTHEFSREALSADAKKLWVKHPNAEPSDQIVDYEARLSLVLSSWRNAFSYLEEDVDCTGLRPPQIGAVHLFTLIGLYPMR